MHSLDNLTAQLQSQIGNWESTNSQTNEKLAQAPQQVKKLLSVGRQQKVKEALYIYLLQKREENELSKTYTAWNTRIIQPPMGSNFPSSPREKMIYLVALALGFCIPAGILFLRESMNHKVRGRADLEWMKTPIIGEIPLLSTKSHWYNLRKDGVKRAIYLKENCNDLINEAFRMLRTKLDYFKRSSTDGNNQIFMITSFNPAAGKSFITPNLAAALSLKSAKVIAIDLDMRRASFSKIFGNPHTGLTDYLTGRTNNIEDVILKESVDESSFDYIPVGILPPNPAELLLSDRIKEMFDKLREHYDYILLDCPPIDIVTDSTIIKDYTDFTLFVVRAGLMDRRNLKEVEVLYKDKTYKRMALILNGTPYVSSLYGNYKYGYSYGYKAGRYGHNIYKKDEND